MNPPPLFPYAPTRKIPLSLWNPLDYLQLLYWMFYFPQALRWYVETFGNLAFDANGREAIRNDPIQQKLAIQGLLLVVAVPLVLAASLRWFGVSIDMVGIAWGIAASRAEAVILTFPLVAVTRFRRVALRCQRISLIPLLGLRESLVQHLNHDWERGVEECEGILRYSLQFVSVTSALAEALQRLSPELLLARITSWCSLPLYDWQVVRFQSASLSVALKNTFWDGFFIVPRHWRPHEEEVLRYDTPARAACAGFWHLHEKEPAKAREAFAVVQHLSRGEELYRNAGAFAAAFACEKLEQIGNWQYPALTVDDNELLRPQVRTVFTGLTNVAQEIALVQRSRSSRQRNSALNRASGLLNALPTQLADCPTPERDLFVKISEHWLRIVLDSASAVGTLEVREVVASPYIVGAPLPANRLTGRQDVFDQINAIWAKPGQRDSLVIFGHRRMGKSSVARNIQYFCKLDENTHLAVLNLQTVDFSDGLNDLCYSLAFRLWESATTLFDEPRIEEFQTHPLPALRRLLATLDRLTPQPRCILILDEYELIDEKLSAKAAEDFVTLLRGLTQQYPWLAMALVGLHSLEERSASFYQAIYAWRPIRVGLMDADAVAEVLQVEDDAFPLEYSLDAVARAHALTGGQPFLVQLLGDSLVQRFNQQLRQQLDPPSPTFSAADVDAVVTDPQFYQQGSIYFRGIWSQAGESPSGQQAILQALALHENGFDQPALEHASGLEPAVFNAALEALGRHDVVTVADRKCRYAVELMRRWVVSSSEQRDSSADSILQTNP
jgi:hypothetical protein